MTTFQHGEHSVSPACNFTTVLSPAGAIHSGDNRNADHGNPGPWGRANHTAAWMEIARALPANLGVEFTAEHGWRIIALSADTRRTLELLDITEGDTLPDAVMLERRRRHLAAQLLLEQARAVLQSVQVDNETQAALRSERVA